MGAFFKKSIKFGPVRFNFSKNGIGTSVGVKGFRVGVNGKGKSYVSGGMNGFYFRNNLPASSNNAGNKPEYKITGNEGHYFFYALLLLISFGFPPMFFGSIPYVLYSAYKRKKITKFKEMSIVELEESFDKKDYNKINNIILNIPKILKDTVECYAYIFEIYPKIILKVFNDGNVDHDEEIIMEKILQIIPENAIRDVNIIIVNEILKNAAADRRISAEEEELINKCIEIFNLNELKYEIKKVINDYKELEKIEELDLSPINPSVNVADNSIFYYENKCEVRKMTSYKGIKSLTHDYNGKLLLSEKNIHIVGDGHKSIKLESIISLDLNDSDIEIVVANRKTPLYIAVNNPISFLAVLKKLA